MKDKVIYFFDLETTDRYPEKCAVVQIGAIKDVNGEIVDEFNLCMRPHMGASIAQQALDVIGKTVEEITDPALSSHREGYWKFMEFMGMRKGVRIYPQSRRTIAGFNVLAFDMRCLQHLAERSDDRYGYAKFHWPALDVAPMAANALMDVRHEMDNFKLMTVAKELGVDTDGQAHDALFDVRVTREIYYKIQNYGVE